MNNQVLIPAILRYTAQHYTNIMQGITGFDPLEETRKRPVVSARVILAHYLLLNGYTENQIGVVLNIDHSTIHHYRKRYPILMNYKEEKELDTKFKQAI